MKPCEAIYIVFVGLRKSEFEGVVRFVVGLTLKTLWLFASYSYLHNSNQILTLIRGATGASG